MSALARPQHILRSSAIQMFSSANPRSSSAFTEKRIINGCCVKREILHRVSVSRFARNTVDSLTMIRTHVENSRPAIATAEKFDMVQWELAERKLCIIWIRKLKPNQEGIEIGCLINGCDSLAFRGEYLRLMQVKVFMSEMPSGFCTILLTYIKYRCRIITQPIAKKRSGQ